MLVLLSQDCIKRTRFRENKTSNSSRLLGMILAFCLEEIVALTRLVHENQSFGQKKANHILLSTLFTHCTKCMRDALYGANTQVAKC